MRLGISLANLSRVDPKAFLVAIDSPELNAEHGPLKPWEYAIFAQGTKWFFDERLKLHARKSHSLKLEF